MIYLWKSAGISCFTNIFTDIHYMNYETFCKIDNFSFQKRNVLCSFKNRFRFGMLHGTKLNSFIANRIFLNDDVQLFFNIKM